MSDSSLRYLLYPLLLMLFLSSLPFLTFFSSFLRPFSRLWESFLYEKLAFNWDEVHEVAEQLEHIQSPLLIQRLDAYLNFPKFDPHGDPIPDEFGDVRSRPRVQLNEMEVNQTGQIVAVKDSSAAFLRYLDKVGAYIGARIKVLDKVEFDGSLEILVDQKKTLFMSKDVASNILVLQS